MVNTMLKGKLVLEEVEQDYLIPLDDIGKFYLLLTDGEKFIAEFETPKVEESNCEVLV